MAAMALVGSEHLVNDLGFLRVVLFMQHASRLRWQKHSFENQYSKCVLQDMVVVSELLLSALSFAFSNTASLCKAMCKADDDKLQKSNSELSAMLSTPSSFLTLILCWAL